MSHADDTSTDAIFQAFQCVLLDQRLDLAHALRPHLLTLMVSKHGNHVVQKMIDVLDNEYLDFVMDEMRGQIAHLSSHQYACRVVQGMLGCGVEKYTREIFDEFFADAKRLAADTYGNYVAQVLLMKEGEIRAKLIKAFTAPSVVLSKQQAASNVIERCILFGTPAQVHALHQEFIKPAADGRSQLAGMITNQFGNYPIRMFLPRRMAAFPARWQWDVQS